MSEPLASRHEQSSDTEPRAEDVQHALTWEQQYEAVKARLLSGAHAPQAAWGVLARERNEPQEEIDGPGFRP